ncbi:MAG: PDZ domain-containing protein [Brevinematales bacterium]|nr:PDZ domain-containing protein [Brevinematales bacterium]
MIVSDLKQGDRASFTVIRDKVSKEFNVRIEARTDQVASDNKKLWPGVSVIPLTEQLRQNLQISENAKGLLVAQVISGSPADIVGLRQSDIITAVNGVKVNDTAAFFKTLREKTDSELWFEIQRGEAVLESLRFKK